VTGADWLVIVAGLAAIAWVNWWFFLAGSDTSPALAPAAGGVQTVDVVVRGGYSPSRIRVHAGRPVRLVFDRREDSGCSEEVVFPSFGIRRFLPPFQKTTVELTPTAPGRFEFTCGMSMLHGRLDVE
jgi:plastocyanin domain-containing protein